MKNRTPLPPRSAAREARSSHLESELARLESVFSRQLAPVDAQTVTAAAELTCRALAIALRDADADVRLDAISALQQMAQLPKRSGLINQRVLPPLAVTER